MAALTDAETCARLGVDRWGLATLVRRGEIDPDPEGMFDAHAVASLAALLTSRRKEALKTLGRLDGPHLG